MVFSEKTVYLIHSRYWFMFCFTYCLRFMLGWSGWRGLSQELQHLSWTSRKERNSSCRERCRNTWKERQLLVCIYSLSNIHIYVVMYIWLFIYTCIYIYINIYTSKYGFFCYRVSMIHRPVFCVNDMYQIHNFPNLLGKSPGILEAPTLLHDFQRVVERSKVTGGKERWRAWSILQKVASLITLHLGCQNLSWKISVCESGGTNI